MNGTSYFIVPAPEDGERVVWQVRDEHGKVIAQSRDSFDAAEEALDSINRAQRADAVYTEGL